MIILDETDYLRLVHNHETTRLIDKSSGKILLEDEFYGDPTCGLIDKQNKWAIVAGEHVRIWTPYEQRVLENTTLNWIHAMRLKDLSTVEILTDPWSKGSAIWELNINNFEVKKIKNFEKYSNQEYTENIIW